MRPQNYWQANALRSKTITLQTNKDGGSYELPDKQVLHKNAIVHGLSTRRASDSRLTRNGKALANDNVLNSSFIKLKDQATQEYLQDMPLEHIVAKDSDNFMFRLPGITLDIANCKVFTKNPTAQVELEEYEITFWYELPEDKAFR